MAASLEQVREALLAALATVPDAKTHAYYVAAPKPPCLMVIGPVDEAVGASFGDSEDWRILVRGIVSASHDMGGQRRLDRWWQTTGTESVQAAIETDVTLGGVVESATVETKTGYGLQSINQVGDVLTCDWTVRVLT